MPEVVDDPTPADASGLGVSSGHTGTAGEMELNVGRRAFPLTQEKFYGLPVSAPQSLECGWHDTSVNPESGAFALVQQNAGLDDLIGEIVRVAYGSKMVYVYVLQAAAIPTQFSLYRRAWLGLGRLSLESLECEVAPVE